MTDRHTTDGSPNPLPVRLWLRTRARSGAIGNVVVFALVATTAASRAAHGVLSPAGLVAIVAGAAVAATTTGWLAGFYEGAAAALHGEVEGVTPARSDQLAGRRPWRLAAGWAGAAGLWAGAGAVLLAAILQQSSAPTLVVVVALLALAAPAAVAVDVAARAAGAAGGAALRTARPTEVPLLTRAWRDLALPAALVQVVVNAGVSWMLFHGAAADGTLTEARAFEDALLFAALVAGLFGALGARWGSVDRAAGRIVLEGADANGPRMPVGPQAVVYAAALAVVATSVVGFVVPATPSLLRVALVRGLLAGLLTLVACALGVVRGAMNTAPAGLGPRPELLAAGPPARAPRRARLVGATAAGVVALLAVAPAVGRSTAVATGLDKLGIVGELDAVAVRVEYDIPLPAGTGSAPQVVGLVRRTGGGEVANGVAGAPSRLDAVVGGKVANPNEDLKGEENKLPQAECAHPGPLTDIAYVFPTDLREETSGAPPIGHATARCGAGPTLELDAVAASTDDPLALGPAVSVGGLTADAAAAPVDGVLQARAAARASGVRILDGLISVDAVEAHGASHTDGSAGGAASDAAVDLTGVTVAGTTFDLRDGDLVLGETVIPAGSLAGGLILQQLSASLAPSGCDLTLLDSPKDYPQGFLFTRPQPELGVAEDGSSAASMAGGLLVQCDLPQDLSEPTGFNPQRVQVLLGFAYTGVTADEDIGGFGLDDLAGGAAGGAGPGLAPPVVAPPTPTAGPLPDVEGSAPPAGDGPSSPPASGPLETVIERVELLAANFAADRPWVWLVALAVWALVGHRGISRVQREIAEAAG